MGLRRAVAGVSKAVRGTRVTKIQNFTRSHWFSRGGKDSVAQPVPNLWTVFEIPSISLCNPDRDEQVDGRIMFCFFLTE